MSVVKGPGNRYLPLSRERQVVFVGMLLSGM